MYFLCCLKFLFLILQAKTKENVSRPFKKFINLIIYFYNKMMCQLKGIEDLNVALPSPYSLYFWFVHIIGQQPSQKASTMTSNNL